MSMAKVTLKGNEVNTNSDIVKIGDSAPDFTLVDSELNNVNLASYEGKKKILSIVPSLDTPVCQKSTQIFNDKVFIPNLDIETSSERDTMPQTMEKKIRGIIINFRDDINK